MANELLLKLKKPVEFEGKTVEEIDLSPLESWTCDDLIRVKKRFEDLEGAGMSTFSLVLPETNLEYCVLVAADVTGLPIELLRSISAKDATQLRTTVVGFFLESE